MEISEKIDQKFKKLLGEGSQILANAGWDGSSYYKHPEDMAYFRWRTEALNLLEKVCGKESIHYKSMYDYATDSGNKTNSYYFKDCYGILEAAYNDYNEDFLVDIKDIIRSELFEDFLSQAEHLLLKGYIVPSASLCGAVLEDALRKLSDKNEIIYAEKTQIDKLNIELARKEAYDKVKQKQITTYADIRNNADHGKFEKVKEEDVADMIRWTRRFIDEYLN